MKHTGAVVAFMVAVGVLAASALPIAAENKEHQQIMAELRMLQEQQAQLQQMIHGLGESLKVITTKMKPGYLSRNGVPYSGNAVMTEFFDRFDVPGGDSLLVVTSEIVDPEYLATPYWTSQQFKRETDASRWRPTPCAAR